MIKNFIIVVLTVLLVLFWLGEEPDDTVSDDPNDVTLEYKCSEVDDYEDLPKQVLEECRARGLLRKSI
jgi:hypothetical protein